MGSDHEDILTRLGLTYNQARIYLALVRTGKAPIKSISDITRIPRESIYRTMPSLEKISLVEKYIDNPTRYEAIPIEEALPELMRMRDREHKNLQQQIGALVHSIRKRKNETVMFDEKPQYMLLPTAKTFDYHVRKGLRLICRSFEGTTTPEGFRYGMFNGSQLFEEAVAKGVKFRHVVVGNDKEMPLGDEKVRKLPLWKVKFSPKLDLKMILIDDREVFISTSADLNDDSYLMSTSPCLISLAHNYFENLWKYDRF